MRPTFLFSRAALLLILCSASALAQVAAPTSPAKPATGAAASDPAPVKIRPMRDPALYKTEVILLSQGDAERRSATARGLAQVVIKLTGNVGAPTNPVIRRAMSTAQAYVSDAKTETASSDAEGNTAVGGVPVYKTQMTLSYDPVAVDALIAGAGLRYWTGVRPKPMLWLAIDDGRGPRLVTGQQLNVVRPLAQRGLERGLRFLLPAGSAIEQAAVPSVLALNAPAMQVLSARYNNDAQLVGKVYRSGGGWTGDWVLSQGGAELARWSLSDPDARRVIASGADPAADAIAKRDSVYLDIGPAGSYMIDIAGVQTQADFVRLMAYLQRLAIVKRVTAVEATADHLRLQLDLGLGLKGFRMIVDTDDTLQPMGETTSVNADGSPGASVPRYGLK
ncbi:DUF2066 domain-containing protein [Arenimonas oryziterrae]|uniref:DUF2066 domain-containing protein n=1 Tax=Arenimonas oryziterrae DSM 21050 = YC6267 TaxID=1121015 RepID=A0A091B0K2_9GAMM|nr:DUF2066 domain-containing protein [Arenimonas oryziterrae]KFN45102.1 hypothetical protein N789_03505 [Arenimonas oryziterrae DSM 21050 = YC6267]